MDPVTALGVASAAFQFLDFALEALALCRQIRDDVQGASAANRELETYSSTLKDLSKELESGTQNANAAGRRINKIARECAAIAGELEAVLLQVRKAGSSKLTDALKTTFRTMKERKTIEKLQNTLKDRRTLLDSAVVQDIRNRVDLVAIQQSHEFPAFKTSIQDLVTRLQAEQVAAEDHRNRTERDLAAIQSQNYHLSQASSSSHAKTQQKVEDMHSSVNAQFSNLTLQNVRQSRTSSASHTKTQQKVDSLRSGMNSQFSKLHTREAREELLISLFYPEHAARRETIKPPSMKTFQWIFNDGFTSDEEAMSDGESLFDNEPTIDPAGSDFISWLECSDSLYWINGKPGSGKSTLMAYIINDDRLKQSLNKWAAGKPLHILSFFFWRPGSPLQKSVIGLLRSLAYQLFEEVPDLADRVLRLKPLPAGRIAAWTEERLCHLLKDGLNMAKGRRICFFVDGLDEFEGLYGDLINVIFDLQHLPHVKICTCSRPEFEIREKLKSYAQLKMEDLNYEDIRSFTESQLPQTYSGIDLCEAITEKAEGVFLWAVLATQSILRGLNAGDEEEVLLQRLQELPKDLNAMFRLMLSRVEPVHKSRLGHLFQVIAILRSDPDRFRPNICMLAAYFYGHKYTTYPAFLSQCASMEKKILALSQGLLQLDRKRLKSSCCSDRERGGHCTYWAVTNYDEVAEPSYFDRQQTLVSSRNFTDHGDIATQFKAFEDTEVGWIHRTVYDFIFVHEAQYIQKYVQLPRYEEASTGILTALEQLLVIGPSHNLQYASWRWALDKCDTWYRLCDLLSYDKYLSRHHSGTSIASVSSMENISVGAAPALDRARFLASLFNHNEWGGNGQGANPDETVSGHREAFARLFGKCAFDLCCIHCSREDYVIALLHNPDTKCMDVEYLVTVAYYILRQRRIFGPPEESSLMRLLRDTLDTTLRSLSIKTTFDGSQRETVPIERYLPMNENRCDHIGLNKSLTWKPVVGIALDTLQQRDIAKLLYGVWEEVVTLAVRGDRLYKYISDKEVLTHIRRIMQVWNMDTEHSISGQIATTGSFVYVRHVISSYSVQEWEDLSRQRPDAWKQPYKYCTEVRYEQHVGCDPMTTNEHAVKSYDACIRKRLISFKIPTEAFRTRRLVTGLLYQDASWTDEEMCLQLEVLIKEVWECDRVHLSAWDQILAIACLRIILKRLRAHEARKRSSSAD